MNRHSDPSEDWDSLRQRIIGLGAHSARKSYYPQLRRRLAELERFKALLDQSNDAIFTAEVSTGRFIDVNLSACQQLGYTRDELLGMTLGNLLSTAPREEVEALLTYTEDVDEEGLTLTTTLQRQDGQTLPVEMTVRLVEFSDALYTVIVARDISERRRVEKAWQKSEAQHRALLENMPIGIYRSTPGPRGEFLTANTAFLRIFGVESQEDLQQIAVCDLYADPEEYRHLSDALMKKGSVAGREIQMIRLDGVPIWGSVTARAIYDERHGEVRYFDSAIEDITERKQVEEEVQRRAAHLEAISAVIATTSVAPGLQDLLETALDRTLHALGLDQGIIWVGNRIAVRGFPPEVRTSRLRDKAGTDLIFQSAVVVNDWQAVSHNPSHDFQLEFFNRFDVKASITVPIVAQGKCVGGLSVADQKRRRWTETEIALVEAVGRQLGTTAERLRLLSEVRRHAEELSAAVSRLEELDRLKSQFIQNVSHELRTPLALIRGYAEMLNTNQLGKVRPEQRKPVSIIARRARMLGDLVEDITLILEAEANPPPTRPVRLDELTRAAGEDFSVAAARTGIKLHTTIESDLPPVLGSPTYLRRILDNLIGNALKFTKEGGEIYLRLERLDAKYAILEVEDTGVGIPEDHLNRIFDRFYQVDGSARRRYGGVGLGLALVKEIVEVFGGQVHVESEVGCGSTFTIILPFALEKQPRA
ncbi:MAG: PAS domain-containing sensor histidine kinase [Anaerolineae bacterium]